MGDFEEEGERVTEMVWNEGGGRPIVRGKDKTYICESGWWLKTKSEKSTRLVYTGFLGELEHLKIETRLIDEMFTSVMGE